MTTFSTQRTLLFMVLISALTITLSACAGVGDRLYQAAIERDAQQAGLESDRVSISEDIDIALRHNLAQEHDQVLVMIHGFSANKENWLRMAKHLHEDYGLVALDLPGHGDSTRSPELSYRIPTQATRVREVLDALDIEQAHLTGNSMGGAIAAILAAEHPERVHSLSLINSAGIHDRPSELEKALERGENPLVIRDTPDFRKVIDFTMEEPPFIPWPISTAMAKRAMANESINDRIFDDLQRDSTNDFKEALESIGVPTLVLWGEKDRVISVDNASLMASRLPDSRLIILEGIGHMPMVEVPKKTAGHIRALIEESAQLTATP